MRECAQKSRAVFGKTAAFPPPQHADLVDAGVKEVPLDGRLALTAVGLKWDH